MSPFVSVIILILGGNVFPACSGESVDLAYEFLDLIIPLPGRQLYGGSFFLGTRGSLNSTTTSLKVGTIGRLLLNLLPFP